MPDTGCERQALGDSMNGIFRNQQAARRAWWIAGALVCAGLVLPVASVAVGSMSKSASAATTAGPEVVHLEVVGKGVAPQLGQIVQPAKPTVIFVGCATGKAIGGGYTLPDSAKHGMVTSAPSADGRAWNFRYPGVVPVGTKYSAVCWRG